MKNYVFILLLAQVLPVLSQDEDVCVGEQCEEKSRSRRELTLQPELQLFASFRHVPMPLHKGSTIKLRFSINHTTISANDAHCAHVRFAFPKFFKYKGISDNFGVLPTVTQEPDDVSVKYPTVLWHYGSVAATLLLTFDPPKDLKPGRHFLSVPLWMHYYDEWEETPEGVTIKEGNKLMVPMTTVTTTIQNGNCYSSLGINSGKIKRYMITASSNYPDSQPSQCRLDEDGWCAEVEDADQYLQVDFEYMTRITKIEIRARGSKPFYVRSFFLQYSMDGEEWIDYYEYAKKKIFTGVTDQDIPVIHWLVHGIEANSIRLRPVTWLEMICVRMELYGCIVKGSLKTCLSALGMESGFIPDEALKSKAPNTTAPGNPSQGRLNKPVTEYPFGWMALKGYVDYFQIDFGGIRKVTRVVTQGGWTSVNSTMSQYFVKSFLMEYANNTYELTYYKENGRLKMVPGPKNVYEAKYQVTYKLKTPIIARYLRFIPMAANFAKVMRVEVVGCLLEQAPAYQDNKDFARRSVLSSPTGVFFVCMFTSSPQESSCFHTSDGQTWNSMDPFVIIILAYDYTNGTIYALDRNFNYRKSLDGGKTWLVILRSEWTNRMTEGRIEGARHIPENLVTNTPADSLVFNTNSGVKWGVSGTGIHMMASAGTWDMVGQWKCCGL